MVWWRRLWQREEAAPRATRAERILEIEEELVAMAARLQAWHLGESTGRDLAQARRTVSAVLAFAQARRDLKRPWTKRFDRWLRAMVANRVLRQCLELLNSRPPR